MFLKYFGLSLSADNWETFPLRELTVKQVFIARKGYGAVPVKRKNIMCADKSKTCLRVILGAGLIL